MGKKARRVVILCENPASIEAVKKNYKPEEGDEEHYFYAFSEALAWLMVENAIGSPPDLMVVDIEVEKLQWHLFILKAKKIAPKSVVLGIQPSKRNEP